MPDSQLTPKSLGRVPVLMGEELVCKRGPWAVKHPADIRQPNILGTIPKLDGCLLLRIAFQSVTEYRKESFRTRVRGVVHSSFLL